MKNVLILCVLFALAGCAIPVVTLQKSEMNRYAIVEVDLESWLGDSTKGEFAYVSHIDGIWDEKYQNTKAGRVRDGGPMIKYIFIEPGAHDLTLVYNRNLVSISGRKVWSGGITEKAILEPGRYFVRYSVEGKFVTLWLEHANGKVVTEMRRSVIADASPQTNSIIPISIPK